MIKFRKPCLIAEISANHCGNISLAKKLIKCAKLNDADLVKLQTYTANTMTIKSNKTYFKIKDGLWKNYSLWDLYDEAHTPLEWHNELFDYAKKIGITIFSTPFDETAVDLLESLQCPIYKLASFEMTDLPLVRKIASTKKPIIISTGMASLSEIEETYEEAKNNGAKDITLLYCVSKYPSENKDFNINNIKILKEKFNCRVGLSDHSKDHNIVRAAIAAGAEIIEKHIALDNQIKGLDIEFSLKGKEIKKFKSIMTNTYGLLGKDYFYRDRSEEKSKIFRRSIFVVKNIKKGERFSVKNIRRIRPGQGVEPKYFEKLLDKVSPFDLEAGEPVTMSIIKRLKI
ncbi:pseudaminic acid synthase [Pelagibacteraceae bacterium]|nr:pseudaminic acid synthase [Pelagibacteraceae bacterium]